LGASSLTKGNAGPPPAARRSRNRMIATSMHSARSAGFNSGLSRLTCLMPGLCGDANAPRITDTVLDIAKPDRFSPDDPALRSGNGMNRAGFAGGHGL